MKKMTILASLMISIVMMSCVPQETPPSTPALSQELTLYNWAEYMPQSVLDSFSAEYGVKVTFLAYDSMDEAIAQLRAGMQHDVVVVRTTSFQHWLQRYSWPRLTIAIFLISKTFPPTSATWPLILGNAHSIPFSYGTTGLVVRSDLVKSPVTSWADLWDPRYAGKIAARAEFL